jgi:hypothetical protein
LYGPRRPLGGIQLGAEFPDLVGVSLEGSAVSLNLKRDKPTVLYVMSPTCGWCRRNYPNVVALAKKAMGDYYFVGVSTTGTIAELRAHLKELPLPFEVFLLDREKLGQLVYFRATPTTLVLSPQGLVAKAWIGAYQDSSENEVNKYFALSLPGLAPTTATPVR